MDFSVYTIITAIVIGFNLVFFQFLFSHRRGHKSLKYLLVAVFFCILWQIREFINAGFLVPESYRHLLWRVGDSMPVLLLVSVYYFHFFSFMGRSERWWRGGVIWGVSAAVITLFLVLGPAYSDALINPYSHSAYTGGTPSLILAIWQLILFAMILAVLAAALIRTKKSGDVRQKKQLKIISFGSALAILLAAVTEIIMPNLGYAPFPLGGTSMTIFLGSILYGIYNFQFFNIRLRIFSIQSKLIISFVVIAVTLTVSLGFLVLKISNKTLAERTAAQLESVVVLKSKQLSHLISEMGGDMSFVGAIMTERAGLGETGETYLVNTENYLLTESRFRPDLLMKEIQVDGIRGCLGGKSGWSLYQSYRGVPVIGVFKWLPERELCLVAEMEQTEAFAPIMYLRSQLLIFTGLALLVVISLAVIVSRTFTEPISRLVKAAEFWAQGDYGHRVDISERGELGILGKTINRAGEELAAARKKEKLSQEKLEKEVSTKTAELSAALDSMKKDQEYLKGQRLATLNILEDVSESQKQLKTLNETLEKKSQELITLKLLGDELSGALDVDKAVGFINRYLSKMLEFSVATYLIIDPIKEGEFVYKTYLKEEVCDSFLETARQDVSRFLSKESGGELKTAQKIIENIRPQVIGKKLNNKIDTKIESALTLPLRIGQDALGVIHLSSKNPDLSSRKFGGLVEAMLATFSLSLARISALIRSQHSRTVSLVESLSDGVIMFDSEREITLVNAAATKYTGLSRKGFSLPEFYRLISGIDMTALVKSALEKGESAFQKEVQLSERYVFEILVIPVKDNQGKVFGGAVILHDITHLKEVDRMKTEFVSVASHQLRTPLTAIKLFTEMMLNEQVGKIKKEQREYLDNIYESTERMVRLVNDLLSLSRLESGSLRVEPKPADLHSFCLNIIKEVAPLAQVKGINIDFSPAGKNLPPITIDVNLMRQVIHNLITNAVRYSVSGGRVEVDITKDEKEYLVRIKDSGIGIPEKARGRIFEKFFRADNAVKTETEGTGLGLYVSKMIVESSGGRIWFESVIGKGTTFYVALPSRGMVSKEGSKSLPGAINEVSYS